MMTRETFLSCKVDSQRLELEDDSDDGVYSDFAKP